MDYVAVSVALVSGYLSYKVSAILLTRPPAGVPLIANPPGLRGFLFRQMGPILKQQFGDPQLQFLQETLQRVGPQGTTFSYEFTPSAHRVMVVHPRDLEHMLVEQTSTYLKGPDYDAIGFMIGKENLVTIRDEEKHAAHRKMVAPAFNPVVLRDVADTVLHHQLADMLQVLDAKFSDPKSSSDGKTVSTMMDVLLDDVALNVVAEAAFKRTNFAGGDIREEFRSAMSNAGLSMFDAIFGRFVTSKKTRDQQKSMKKIRVAGAEMARQVRQEQTSENATADKASNKQTLIDYLVKEESLSSSALLDHIVTFLFAGHETSSKALLWTCFALARNPQIQEELFEELSSALSNSAIPTLDAVKDLPLLSHVVKESLRLYPPIPLLLRRAQKDDVLPYSKVFIAKGHSITLSMFLTHRLESVYGPDAHLYKPHRWEDPALEERVGRCGWMPFFVGKRNCIGKDFAWNEILIVTATLFRRYEFSLPKDFPEPSRTLKISMRPREPIPFHVRRREH